MIIRLLFASFFVSCLAVGQAGELEVGEAFPNHSLEEIRSGEAKPVHSYFGKKTILHVFASW